MSASWDEAAWTAFVGELRGWQDAGRVATFWWRDDDAGRPDPALERLVALAAKTGLPLGLAVVPAWLTPEVAAALRDAPPGVAVLQHGWAHANHEPAAAPGVPKRKPAECGAARPAGVVLAEVTAGWARLSAAVGARALPVFVPPWNRIAPAVRDGLPAAGYRALSAFGPRDPAPGLRCLNCHADPVLWREGKRFAGCAATLERLRDHLVARREGRVDPTEPTGLLTHHRDITADFWEFVEEWLARLREHPAVRFPAIPALIGSGSRDDPGARGGPGVPEIN
jgi:hypothetical protein